MRVRGVVGAVAAAGLAAACIGPSEPADAIVSVGRVVPPSPSVVRGDVMRDSTGAAAPLRVAAFNSAGDTVAGTTATFLDLARGITILDGGIVRGDSVTAAGDTVVAVVAGIQTARVAIPVTVPPTTFVAEGSPWDIAFGFDTATTANREALPVRARGAGDTAAVGFIVQYTIFRAPAGRGAEPVAWLAGDDSKPSERDTTSATGTAQRYVVLRQLNLADSTLARLAGGGVDTIGVRAELRWPGYASLTTDFLVQVRAATGSGLATPGTAGAGGARERGRRESP